MKEQLSVRAKSLELPSSHPIVIEINATGNTESDTEILLKKLKKIKLYRENLLYRGFDGEKLQKILKDGVDHDQFVTYSIKDELYNRPSTWCCPEAELKGRDGEESAFEYALCEKPAIALYNGELMTNPLGNIDYEYAFNPGVEPLDALIGVVLLKPWMDLDSLRRNARI